jgi:hypothetical protein
VPYQPNNKDDLKIAHSIRSILHVTARNNIKASPINYDTKVYYFNKAVKLQEDICNIVINLKL